MLKNSAKVSLWLMCLCPCLRDWSKFTRGLGRGSPAGPGSVHVVCVWVLARPRVQAGVTGSHSDSCRRHSPVVRRQQTWQHHITSEQSDSSDGMIQSAWCSVNTLHYSSVCWPVQCQSQAVNTLKQVMTVPWCISNCALWMPPWHESCFNVLFRTWKEENTVAFIWLHFARPEGWKAQGLRWVSSQIAQKRLNFGDS